MASAVNSEGRQLALLGLLLQALHVLFGVTGIIGVLINLVWLPRTQGSVYESHLRWQIATFWAGLCLYVLAWICVHQLNAFWPLLVPLAFVAYRVLTAAWFWQREEAIERIF